MGQAKIGGDLRITAVEPYVEEGNALLEELLRLNEQYVVVDNDRLKELYSWSENAGLQNDIVQFHLLKDNYDEIFYAADLFEGVVMAEKEAQVKKAEITDQRIFLKIKAKDFTDFKLGLLVSLAFCNLTDGIVDLTAYADAGDKFADVYYTKEAWAQAIEHCFLSHDVE